MLVKMEHKHTAVFSPLSVLPVDDYQFFLIVFKSNSIKFTIIEIFYYKSLISYCDNIMSWLMWFFFIHSSRVSILNNKTILIQCRTSDYLHLQKVYFPNYL